MSGVPWRNTDRSGWLIVGGIVLGFDALLLAISPWTFAMVFTMGISAVAVAIAMLTRTR